MAGEDQLPPAPDRERALAEIRQGLPSFKRTLPSAHEKAAAAYWDSVASASRWRVKIGIGLIALLLFQVMFANCIIWRVCSTLGWRVETAQLATILGAILTEVSAIAVIFVKWLFADEGVGKFLKDAKPVG